MRIAIMGSGGVGGYYGGLLTLVGHDVAFIARGAHLAAMQANGLRIHSVYGDFTLQSVQATDRPADIETVELVLMCVKTPDTTNAAQQILPLIGPDTVVLSLQNGVEAPDQIGAIVGMSHVVGGATWISSSIEAPGVIRQVSQFRRIVLGELDGRITPRVERIREVLSSTGATVELSRDIQKVMWTKFVFIAAISGIGALTRLELGKYRHVPETRAMLTALMREVEAVARAAGVALDPYVVEQSLAFIDKAAAHIKPSMQLDVEAGRRSELDSMIGVIGRRGRALGVPTPVADLVYAALLPVEQAACCRERGTPNGDDL